MGKLKFKKPAVLGNVCNWKYNIDCAPMLDPKHIFATNLVTTIDTCGERKAKDRIQAHYHKISHDCKVRGIRKINETRKCVI